MIPIGMFSFHIRKISEWESVINKQFVFFWFKQSIILIAVTSIHGKTLIMIFHFAGVAVILVENLLAQASFNNFDFDCQK